MLTLIGAYVFIFFARVADVSIGVVRTLMLVKGKKLHAAVLGFFEVIIFILALNSVVNDLDDPIKLLFYGLGFATGNIVGSNIEERLALGHLTVQVITLNKPLQLCKELREQGYGVTIIEGQGKQGIRRILNIILSRKELPKLMSFIDKWDSYAFTTVFDTRHTKGGIFSPTFGKRK
ncbi:MAG: DUF2179 domain-containing protein [Bacillota bacterium]|nr:DUF2179 domain-containing protein [Bacillota bacterium]